MEIDKLIEKLLWYADNCYDSGEDETLRKAAETIKLMCELIIEENNEKSHRMIDDMENNNAK